MACRAGAVAVVAVAVALLLLLLQSSQSPPLAPASAALVARLTAAPPSLIRSVAPLAHADLAAIYAARTPALFTRADARAVAPAVALTRRDALRASFGALPARLFSSELCAKGADRNTTLGAYLDADASVPVSLDAASHPYMFGRVGVGTPLVGTYVPPLGVADAGPFLVQFGAAGALSGTGWHRHGTAFVETTHGRKAWFLSPPDRQPTYNYSGTMLQWALARWGAGGGSRGGDDDDDNGGSGILHAVVGPGDVLHIPAGWWHAALNLDAYVAWYSCFVADAWEGSGEVTLMEDLPDEEVGEWCTESTAADGDLVASAVKATDDAGLPPKLPAAQDA